MFRNQSVNVHRFSMVPRAEIPRASFRRQSSHKTTFDAGYLVPVYVDEVLPGDSFSVKMTAFARMSTPIFPIMDNLFLDSFFFFIPNRLVWTNWRKMMGEQDNPGDSISFTVPNCNTPAGGYAVGSLQDYMGLPTVGQMAVGGVWTHNTLALRAYNLVYNEWFRDQNLQSSVVVDKDDGPDNPADYVLLRRGKRHDYFTSALPWPQKGNTAVSLPLGTTAPVVSNAGVPKLYSTVTPTTSSRLAFDSTIANTQVMKMDATTNNGEVNWGPSGTTTTGLFADLSAATAATINQIRTAFQIQKLLERDARGGTRYTEIVRAHFGVISPDARLQRPEYLGGGSTSVNINPIAQTSATGVTGGSTPVGTLSAMGSVVSQGHGFSQSFTEHGIVLGIVSVRADLTYQQGVRRMWKRNSRYDFYWPAFAMLGEQVINNYEIFVDGSANDDLAFGYQERWAEYRHMPSMITGQFRSTHSTPLDGWHLAQEFATLPTLNATFIEENPPMSRVLAVGASANGQQFIFDSFFDVKMARPMPLYSVPGLLDHF